MGKDLKGRELGVGFSQRKDGRYNYRFTDRFGHRETIYHENLTKLKHIARNVHAKDVLKLNGSRDRISTNEMFELTIDVYKSDKLSEDTKQLYISTYNRYVRDGKIGNMPFVSVTPLLLKSLFNEIAKKYSQSICGVIHSIFLGMYDAAVLEGIVVNNFIPSIKVKSKKETKIISPMSVNSQKLFTCYCQQSFYVNLFILALNTGLRVSELIGLTKDEIDLKNNVILLKHQLLFCKKGTYENGLKYKFSKPKYDSKRRININATAKNAILNQFELLQRIKRNEMQTNNKPYKYIKEFDELLFLSRSGTPLAQSMLNTEIHKIVNTIIENGYYFPEGKFGMHVLRHTFATRCAELGMQPSILKELMGHKSINTTMNVYVYIESSKGDTSILDDIVPSSINNKYNLLA